MMNNNLRVLRAYVLGIAISLIVSLAIGALYKFWYIVPTIITSITTYCLLYRSLWKMGQQDSERKLPPLINVVFYTAYFVGITAFFEIVVGICAIFNLQTLQGIFTRAGIVWFLPFSGFLNETTFLALSPVITLITIIWCMVSYRMGSKQISILQTIKNRL